MRQERRGFSSSVEVGEGGRTPVGTPNPFYFQSRPPVSLPTLLHLDDSGPCTAEHGNQQGEACHLSSQGHNVQLGEEERVWGRSQSAM
ncbi:hypothetical protein CesoFtcFv8_001953 [Champsocephalus esox]|uniref:Uncharacterized protein n=1 Tax=Champsocephalus esox TaxID=159716 RepID=A0AAN8HE32_9TELE|nr:hypothetical protein CesoFtcFv8_001953 [Champsocephalus esox]